MKKVVLVDMDGVLADFHQELFKLIKQDYPNIILPSQHTKYYISDHFEDQKTKESIWKIKNEPGFFFNLPVVKNGILGLKRIMAAGYHPRICSSPLRSNPTCEGDKMDWIKKYLVPEVGKFIWDEAIITYKKAEHDGIVLIDDKPDIKNSEKASWKQVVFDRFYNADSKAPYRLLEWSDPNLEKILKECEE